MRPLGIDVRTGIVHYHSGAKRPLCSIPDLELRHIGPAHVVTCVECLARYQGYASWKR